MGQQMAQHIEPFVGRRSPQRIGIDHPIVANHRPCSLWIAWLGAEPRILSQCLEHRIFCEGLPYRPGAGQREQRAVRTCNILVVIEWRGSLVVASKQAHETFLSPSAGFSDSRVGMTVVRSATNQPGKALSGSD